MDFSYTVDQLLLKIARQGLRIDRLEEIVAKLDAENKRLRDRPIVSMADVELQSPRPGVKPTPFALMPPCNISGE